MTFSRIAGTGSYLPGNIVTNDQLADIVDTSDEWISTRTGIKERRVATVETTVEIASKAANNALLNSNIKAGEIDLIIVATITPDNFMPSTACSVQAKIGAANAFAFDISAACTGFIYALGIANAFLKSGLYKNALVVGAETLSKIVDWNDRNTCVLFGDGAGAAVLTASDKPGIREIELKSDGSREDLLNCPALPSKNAFSSGESLQSVIKMNGKEVFKFAGKIIVQSIEKLLKNTNTDLGLIDCIICHQANIRIIQYAAEKLSLPIEKFFINIDRFGNTSAASIPIALDEAVKTGAIKRGDKIIAFGFGGGLTWGAALIDW
ncbi:MAG: beta-ketoacyl-ACP synthase III [Bacillota bacterium]|nr:beta-ketoacyl-ACP synthase III [Bacillota bacterium]